MEITSMDSFDDNEETIGPGWKALQDSIENLRSGFTNLCDSLTMIVNIENKNVLSTGSFVIPETSRILLEKETKFIEQFRKQVTQYKRIELDGGEHAPEYVNLYKKLVNGINNSIAMLSEGIIKQLNLKTQAHHLTVEENKKLNFDNIKKDTECLQTSTKYADLNGKLNTMNVKCTKLEEQLQRKSEEIAQ